MTDKTYYDYINDLYNYLQVKPLSANAQLLYHTLLMIFNKAHWEDELQRNNLYICNLCGLGVKAMTIARNELKQNGFIDFLSDRRRGHATVYRLCGSFCGIKTSSQTHDKRSTNVSQPQGKGNVYKDIIKKTKEGREDITPLSPFEGALEEKVNEWICYKSEKRQAYKPMGLKSLYSVLEKNLKLYGEEAVIAAIDESMANNWQGLFFGRSNTKTKNVEEDCGGSFLQMLREGDY